MNRRAFVWVGSLAAALVAFAGRIREEPTVRPERSALTHVGYWHDPHQRLPGDVFAHVGEIVTCNNGHPICTFTETVLVGQDQDLKRQLGDWMQEEPEPGMFPLPVCAKCGSKFALADGHFHFRGGWR